MATTTARRPAKPPKAPDPRLREAFAGVNHKPGCKLAVLDDVAGELDLRDDEGPRWQLLPIDRIQPSPHNPRKTFDPDKLAALAVSIKAEGVLQPLIVLPVFNGKYEIAYGERRYRASLEAGLKMVPCIVQNAGEGDPVALDVARLQENRDREDLTPIDEARAFEKFTKPKAEGGHGLKQAELAARLGVTQSHVSNRVRLLALPKRCQDLIISGEMSVENGRMLATWCDVPAVLDRLEKAPNSDLLKGEWKLKQLIEEACPAVWRLPAKVIEKHKAALGLRALKDGYSSTELATGDVDLARRLIEEHKAKEEAKWASEGAGPKGAAEDDPKAAAKKKAEVYNKKLYRYRVEWLRDRLIERVDVLDITLLWRWCLVFATGRNGCNERDQALGEVLGAKGYRNDSDFAAVAKQDPATIVREVMKYWLAVDVTRYGQSLDASDIETLAAQAGSTSRRNGGSMKRFWGCTTSSSWLGCGPSC